MVWLLGLAGPTLFGWAVLAETTGTGSSLTEALVAFGVITGLSGAVAKLYANNQAQAKEQVALLNQMLPVLQEAIAEARENRRERGETKRERERMVRLMEQVSQQLASTSPASRRRST